MTFTLPIDHHQDANLQINGAPVSSSNPVPVSSSSQSAYPSPNGKLIQTSTTLDSLFSDDFGGTSVNLSNWDVIDGGLAAVVNGSAVSQLGASPVATFAQAKIGSGITGMTDSVSASALTVNMGTTLGAERWYLSDNVFAGKEDIFVILSKSQAIAANSVFIGLIEVDPATYIPLLNPNIAADGNGSSEFTNRGGAEFGLSTTNTNYWAEAIGDSSPAKQQGIAGAALAAWSTSQECLIEIDSRDITVSTASVDNITAKASAASRVSSQCPNDKKLYKLVMRFRNTTAPGSATTVSIQRIIVVDNYEQRVQLSTGEGDQNAQKAVPVNIVGGSLANVAAGSATILGAAVTISSSLGPSTFHKLISAATTNSTVVKASVGNLAGGQLFNTSASTRYFKLYNKATAPTVGTDTPINTWPIPAGQSLSIGAIVGAAGLRLTAGIAYAITGAAADSDTTAVAAGDVLVNLSYV